MLHAFGVAALCAGAAWAAERALAQLGGPRRLAWTLGMIASVVIALLGLRAPAPVSAAAAATDVAVAGPPAHSTAAPISVTFMQLPAMQSSGRIDLFLGTGWILLSAVLLSAYLLTARRLAARARGWSRMSPATDDVLLADDMGPAVFGLWRSRVVLPRWLDAVSASAQRLVLAHERQHVAARDPQLLAFGLSLVMLFPWNLALLWQLARLRFALEVDCDARVLASVDPAEYGEALLQVSQQVGRAPAGAIALIERPSHLERRIEIMTTVTRRFRRTIAMSALGAAAVCLLAATSLKTPALAAVDVPLKPTPTGAAALRLGQTFERLLADRFPDALETMEPGSVVVALVNEDWSIANAALVYYTGRGRIPVDVRTFGVLGIEKQDVPYVGAMRMQSPKNPDHWLMVLYTERNTPGMRFVSHLFPDTRAVDRQIFRKYFPEAVRSGVPAGQQVWVLLDREGHVLRSGQESIESSSWNRALEGRFAGIKTEGITVTPVTNDAGDPVLDQGGKELQLVGVWLAPGSPPPKE